MSAENVWEKGMAARRGISNLMPTYSKILKFKVLKPMVTAGEKTVAGDFDVELEQDSGGSDDSELFKLLLKVSKKNFQLVHKYFKSNLICSQNLFRHTKISQQTKTSQQYLWMVLLSMQ